MSTPRRPLEARRSDAAGRVGTEPYRNCRERLLARLRQGPAWTLDLRREPHRWSANPAQRVAELRDRGFDVRTVRAWLRDLEGLPIDYRDFYVLFIKGKSGLSRSWWGPWDQPLYKACKQ